MATDSEPDNLPVPAESARTYIRIRPTDATLAAATLTAQHRRLHHLLQPPRGWRATPPTLELLLVSSEANTVDYYAGITDPEKHDGLERVLRSLFPDAYEFDRVTCADSWLAAPVHAAGSVATIEYHGRGDHPKDWQTQLTPYETFVADEHGRVPLASVVEALATSETPAVYQVLLRAKPDWTRAARNRVIALEAYQDTVIDQVTNAIMGPPESDVRLPPADETRIEEIQAREAHTTFETAVRVAAFGEGAVQLTETLQSAFVEVGRSTYTIRPRQNTGRRAKAVFSQIEKRAFPTRTLRNRLPIARRTRSTIVADCTEIANFTMLDGNALTDAGVRSVGSTPSEQSPVTRPPAKQLETYQTAGMTLGYPLDEDGTPDSTPIALPPSLQPMHLAWFGKSGSGKTVAIINAILDAVASTEGVNIIVDWKGDGLGEEYCAAHYARYGTLDNVSYFDCARVLPAFSFFDIRDELAAGISRTTAVEDRVDHYIEILTQLMGRERFDQAVRSPDIIRYLTKAAFDPIHGDDAYSHRHLHGMVRRMHERQSAPGVSDPDLERMLGGVVANQTRSFDEIMQGVANRMEKIPVDRRLARIFNHVPADDDDPHFDLLDYLDETHVIIFDMGSLRSDAQRVLTLVVFSNLWTALRRRHRQYREMEAKSDVDLPLVNLFIDEAASVITSDLLTDLLSQGRSFRCSVTLATQFPGQLKDQNQRVYEEILNNVSTFVTGNVAVDPLLAERLATDDMDATAVGNRLRALRRGQWLVNLPANFNEPEPRPFLVGSVSLPPAHPDGPQPFTPRQQRAFERAFTAADARTLDTAGLTLTSPNAAIHGDDTTAEMDEEREMAREQVDRVDSALPHTKRLPATVEYDAELHALRCLRCDSRYNPTIEGLVRTIECCSSLDDVDTDDIPICELNLKLSPAERETREWSDHQLMFLQAVYNAQQLRYDPLEYDLLSDSMLRLQEYVGVDSADLEPLLDADHLRHDTDHPHRLYTVTPTGRDVIGESYREGVDYGHRQGDLEESSQHVFAVEVGRQYLEQRYVADPTSPVVEVIPYYDLDGNRRLDIAGVDAAGAIRVAVEAERINHDVRRAVPEDFDKMADCSVDEAIWIVMSRAAGHDVLAALNDPPDGPVRVEKTYAETTPPQQFRIDTPGLTAIYPVEWLRDNEVDL